MFAPAVAERMYSVQTILEVLGHEEPDDLELGESLTISNDPYMDLVIERVATNCISVMHTTKQNGDTLRDPEVVFDFEENPWKLVRFRQDPAGIDIERIGGIREFSSFINQWDDNLEKQGFIDAARDQAGRDDS